MLYASGDKKSALKDFKRIPIGKVEIYDTPYTVPSHGFCVEFFEGGNVVSHTFGTLKYTGRDSKIMDDWGEGAPMVISSTPYQVRWHGWFYAKFTGTYTFVMRGPTECEIAGFIRDIGQHPLIWEYDETPHRATKQRGSGKEASFDYSCTAGTWYPIRFDYWCDGAPSFITVLYREPENVQDADGNWSDYDSTGENHHGVAVEEYKVISAGVVNYGETWVSRDDAEFVHPIKIPVLSIKGKESLANVSEYSFEVPINTQQEDNEYYFDATLDEIVINSTNLLGSVRYYNGSHSKWYETDPTLYREVRADIGDGEGTVVHSTEKQYCDWCKSIQMISSQDEASTFYRWKVKVTSGEDYVFSAWVWVDYGVTSGNLAFEAPSLAIEYAGSPSWVLYSCYDLEYCGTWQHLVLPFTATDDDIVKLLFYNRDNHSNGKEQYYTMPKLEKATVATPQFTSPTQKIKKNRLVKIYAGYQNGCNFCVDENCENFQASGWFQPTICSEFGNPDCPYNTPKAEDYQHVFTGFTDDFEFSRTDSENKVKVSCRGIDSLLVDGLDESFPNMVSYYAAGYMEAESDNGEGPNGILTPEAYDGWILSKAIRDLCLHAGIDPTLLYGKEELTLSDGTEGTGRFLIGQPRFDEDGPRLHKNYFYGDLTYTYPGGWLVGDADPPGAEEEYNWGGEFGGTLIDRVNSLSEAYGCMYGTRYDGSVYFKSINTPIFFTYAATGSTYGWTLTGFAYEADIQAIKGGLLSSSTSGNTATCHAFGGKFQLAFVRSDDFTADDAVMDTYRDCIQDEVTGGYPACEPGHSCRLLQYFINYPAVNQQISGAYFTIRASQDITVDKLILNINRPAHYNADFEWTYNIDIGEISGYPDTSQDVLPSSVTYTRVLDSADAYELNRIGEKTVSISGYSMTSGSYYVVKFSPDPISITQYGTYTNCVDIDAVKGGDEDTFIRRRLGGSGWIRQHFWGDITYIGSSNGANDNIEVTVSRSSDGEVVYNERFNLYFSGEDRYYYDGLDTYSGKNPCILTINAQDLISENTYYGFNATDVYDIEIKNVSSDTVKLEALLAYTTDINARVWGFSTAEDVMELKVDSNPEDVRNDVFIVGAIKGPIRDLEGRVLNPNNPELEYFYSRATDLNSIYQLDAENAMGRKKPFVLQLPQIRSAEHANWLSINTLAKYRLEPKAADITSQGINLIELGDCVGIDDVAEQTIEMGENVWVQELEHGIEAEGKYISKIRTTSIEPWESYYEKDEPDINAFVDSGGNPQAFVNISITTTMSGFDGYTAATGYDCYESEEQNYIKIEYFQVQNGHVRIYIYPSGDDSMKNSPVAIILPPTKDGVDLPPMRYQDWGRHTILWDGIAWSVDGRPIANNIGYYVEDGNWCVAFEMDKNGEPYTVYTDNLPTNDNLNSQAQLYITTVLSEYPTAGRLDVSPTGCDYDHHNLLIHDEVGSGPRSGQHDGIYWSKPANGAYHVTCIDFDENNAGITFSASGYRNGEFRDRWVQGLIKMNCVEYIYPDIFSETSDFEYRIGLSDDFYVWFSYRVETPHFTGEHHDAFKNFGIGGGGIISQQEEEFEVGGFYNIDNPAATQVSPKRWRGKWSNQPITLERIELPRDFERAYNGPESQPFGGYIELHPYGGNWPPNPNQDGFLHSKAIVIDCSDLRDRAGRPIYEHFHYGSGETYGAGTTKEGYRLCRFDRMFGQKQNVTELNTANCGGAVWEAGNDWENIPNIADYNRPENWWKDYRTPYTQCTECNTMCRYSAQNKFVPIVEEDDDGNPLSCVYFRMVGNPGDEGGRVWTTMIQAPQNRHALNRVIYWHKSNYDYYPFCWVAGGNPQDASATSWSKHITPFKRHDDKQYCKSALLDCFWAARVLPSGSLVEGESGQAIKPFS